MISGEVKFRPFVKELQKEELTGGMLTLNVWKTRCAVRGNEWRQIYQQKGKKWLWIKEWRHLSGNDACWKKIFTLQEFLELFHKRECTGVKCWTLIQTWRGAWQVSTLLTYGLILVSWNWIPKRLRDFLNSPSLSDSNTSWLFPITDSAFC